MLSFLNFSLRVTHDNLRIYFMNIKDRIPNNLLLNLKIIINY